MFYQCFARGTVTCNDIYRASRQANFDANFGKGQGCERSKLGRFEYDCVTGCERRRNFPSEHQQRKIPRNDLANDAARGVAGKLSFEQLRPAGVMVEMTSDERNINVAALANWFSIVNRFEHGK